MTGTYTVTATHSSGATEIFSFSIDSLLDTDGDGLPDDLPSTYNPANPPTSGLIADDDDDGDGLLDSVETGTGFYINGQNTGTDPLDPDTDDDGICDGPNAVPPVCIAGPDSSPNGNTPPPTLVALNNTDIGTLAPYMMVPGGTFEISPAYRPVCQSIQTPVRLPVCQRKLWTIPRSPFGRTILTELH